MAERNGASFLKDEEISLYALYLIIKKRFKLILILFISTVLITLIISFIMTPIYRSEFVVKVPVISIPVVSPSEAVHIIKELDKLIKEKRFREVSDKLRMQEEKTREIVAFKQIASKEVNYLEITVDIKDPLLINDLKNGVLDYLNNNQYVMDRISLNKEKLTLQKKEIQEKIDGIEGLKNIVISQIKKNTIKDIGFNPIGLDKEVIELKDKLKDIENQIILTRGFEILAEPYVPQKPVKPKKAFNTAIAGLTSLFLGVFLAFFLEWIENNRNKKSP